MYALETQSFLADAQVCPRVCHWFHHIITNTRFKLHVHYFYEIIDLSTLSFLQLIQIIGPAVAGLPDLLLRLCAMMRLIEFLLAAWPKWNVRVPTGHTACLRVYSNYKVPLNLFQNAPVFQLRYGETVTLPYVRATNVGVDDQVLLLTDHDDGSKSVHKARLYLQVMRGVLPDHGQDNQLQLNNGVTDLTELDLSECNIDIKPIVGACPQLQRLNLTNIRSLRLEELQVIATCCCNLQGLNLMEIQTLDNNFCVNVWETLSSMKLTHLSMDTSLFGTTLGDVHKTQLVALFKQCTTLQALELSGGTDYGSQTYFDLHAISLSIT